MATRTRNRKTDETEENTEVEPIEETEEVETDEVETDEVEAEEAKDDEVEPILPVTPFQAAKRVNQALKDAGLTKKIQAPMLYTYANKDKFKTRKARKVTQRGIEKEVLEIDEESFMLWMTEYVKNAVAKATGAAEVQKVADEEADKAESGEQDWVAQLEAQPEIDDSEPAEAE